MPEATVAASVGSNQTGPRIFLLLLLGLFLGYFLAGWGNFSVGGVGAH